MAVTSSQIEAILSISSTASLISGAASLTDTTVWSNLSGVTDVKILLWIQDSTLQSVYKNAGYDAADFTSPDLEPLTTPITYSFTLPTVTGGAYLEGEYTIGYKVLVTDADGDTNAYKALYMSVCSCCNGIEPDVRGEVSYSTAVVSVTDYTNYKTWTSLTNTVSLYAPVGLAAVQTGVFSGSPATLTFVPPSGTFPYTGTWQWKLTSDITYTDATTATATTCRITSQGSFEVVQSQLCKVRCLLDKYRTDVYRTIARKSDAALERAYAMAMDEYLFAYASERCGLPQTTIDKYVNKIYEITGIDPNCDCGCDDGVSQPLTPTSIINGTDGTDGATILSGSGAPAGGTGAVGDYYIDTATGNWYKKTGGSSWTFQFQIVGATGAAGADGTNGAAMLHNDVTDSTTTTNALELLSGKTYTMPAGTLSADGDMIRIRARFKATASYLIKYCYVYIGGSSIGSAFMYGQPNRAILDFYVSRTGATSGEVDGNVCLYATPLYSSALVYPIELATIARTWANQLDIQIYADDSASSAITCELFQVELLKYGTQVAATGIQYSTPFTTTAAVQAYPNVIGTTGKTIRRVYLDGELLDTADWTYDNTTDILTFVIVISGASEVQIDYQ